MSQNQREKEYSETGRKQLADELAKRYLNDANARLSVITPRESFYTKYGKRMLDLVVALPAFLIALPVNGLLGLCTWLDVGKPLFFLQERIGKDGKPFVLVKFRNMLELRDADGVLLPAKDRVTRFGRLVRRVSLDELLNLWSVLKGDMSIIGPRPMPLEYGERFCARHNCRHLVRPGLECPFLHRLDHSATWNDQFENDVWYVENISLKLDIQLFFRLICMVFEKKRSKQRSVADRGSFLGYDRFGQIVTTKNVWQVLSDTESVPQNT